MLGCIRSAGNRDLVHNGLPEARTRRISTVKKLLLLVMVAISAFALWRKVQADRAELNLWTEATTADD